MKIQQIRNATLKINYAGKFFLIDPWLVEKNKFGNLSKRLMKLKIKFPRQFVNFPSLSKKFLQA